MGIWQFKMDSSRTQNWESESVVVSFHSHLFEDYLPVIKIWFWFINETSCVFECFSGLRDRWRDSRRRQSSSTGSTAPIWSAIAAESTQSTPSALSKSRLCCHAESAFYCFHIVLKTRGSLLLFEDIADTSGSHLFLFVARLWMKLFWNSESRSTWWKSYSSESFFCSPIINKERALSLYEHNNHSLNHYFHFLLWLPSSSEIIYRDDVHQTCWGSFTDDKEDQMQLKSSS